MHKLIILFLFVLSLACSTAMHLPGTRFETPETTGTQGKFEIAPAEIHTGVDVDVMNSDIRTPPVIGNANIVASKTKFGFGTRFGAFERLDFGFKYVATANPVLFAKWRVWGKNRVPGTSILTLTAGVGNGGVEETFPTIGESMKISYIRKSVTREFAAIWGYRFDPKWIGYFSPYYSDAMLDLEWRTGGKAIVTERTVRIASKAFQYGALAGAEYRFPYYSDKAFRIISELGISQTRYEGAKKTGFFMGVGINLDAPF